MTIGKNSRNTFRMNMAVEFAGVFAQRNGKCRFFPKDAKYSVNGRETEEDFLLHTENYYLFVLAGGCYVAWYGQEERSPDFSKFDPTAWYVYTPHDCTWSQALTLAELPAYAKNVESEALVTFDGLGHHAFRLNDILTVAEYAANETELSQSGENKSGKEALVYRCPTCTTTFNAGEILFIAAHPALSGDNLLGPNAMQRFRVETEPEGTLPMKVLDAYGNLCHEKACPHCHHKLPNFFEPSEQHFFSLIGGQNSGKAYYLAALVHEAETIFSRDFSFCLQDAAPATNAPLHDLLMRLQVSSGPQAIHLGKTLFKENLHRKVWKGDSYKKLPTPFVYAFRKETEAHSVTFYNHSDYSDPAFPAGSEHALFFLFDPTTNAAFRALLRNTDDPQLQRGSTVSGRQALLLSEIEIRVRTELGLKPGERSRIPLAVIINKSDCWQSLLGPEPLLPIVRNGVVKMGNIEANSDRIRTLLFRICPNVCTNAEAISENVCYFAVSSLGSAPVEFRDETTGETRSEPQPGSLRPSRVSDPLLWAMSLRAPSLFLGTNT